MVDFLPGLLYGIGRKSDKETGVGEIFWEDGSGEKRNRCESCANSSLYLGSACQKLTGQPGRGRCMMIFKSGDLPDCCTGNKNVSTPRVTGCTDEKI